MRQVYHTSIYPLIAEPDPDLRQLYGIYLSQMGYKDIVITDSGRKCLAEVLKLAHSQSYHVIVLDTHLKDIPVTQVAKKIIDKKPDQQIIFTTTLTSDNLNLPSSSTGRRIIRETILTKPFVAVLCNRQDHFRGLRPPIKLFFSQSLFW